MKPEEQAMIDEIIAIKKALYNESGDYEKWILLYEETARFLIEARKCNPDSNGVLLWHICVGSTPPEVITSIDFKDPEWSVLEFMRKIKQRI